MEVNGIQFEDKYIVLKLDDIDDSLSGEQVKNLLDILKTISEFRESQCKKQNKYFVINSDEGYVYEVVDILVRNGHYKKEV